MDIIKGFFEHTPWWVFAIFAYLLWKGVQGLRTRTVSLVTLAIMPAFFAALGIYSLFQTLGLNGTAVAIFVAALAAGVGCGFGLSRLGTVRGSGDRSVEISGSPIPLILMLAIFVSKYALGYWLYADPTAPTTLSFLAVDAIVSGFVIGNFLGRYLGIVQRYRQAEQVVSTAQ